MEYYVVMRSCAAPFVSDTDSKFVEGDTPWDAMTNAIADYKHPFGLYSAALWKDANEKEKGMEPLVKWVSEKAAKAVKARKKDG